MERSFFTNKNYIYDTGTFLERPNRFIALVNYKSSNILRCHVPDPGRLKELLIENRKVLLRFAPDQKKMKTDASVIGVFNDKIWVSLDSQLANRFIATIWKNIPIINEYETIKSEFKYGNSRIDFILQNSNKKCLVEVKTATLVINGLAMFPDAPTERGARHVTEITEATSKGYEGLIVFVVPRSDVKKLTPNKKLDSKFYHAVKKSISHGVKYLVLRCDFTKDGLKFVDTVPFELD